MSVQKIWFTSDHHFGHQNIIRFSNRPFASTAEMNEVMVQRWNARVAPGDVVYHLGDFAFLPPPGIRALREQLHGTIRLLRGNHDKSIDACASCFDWIKDYYELKVEDADAVGGKRKIILLHYALRVWNASHHGAWHLYGHSHGELPDDPASLSLDVGVDCHNFYPISYEEVKSLMAQKTWTPPFAQRS